MLYLFEIIFGGINVSVSISIPTGMPKCVKQDAVLCVYLPLQFHYSSGSFHKKKRFSNKDQQLFHFAIKITSSNTVGYVLGEVFEGSNYANMGKEKEKRTMITLIW